MNIATEIKWGNAGINRAINPTASLDSDSAETEGFYLWVERMSDPELRRWVWTVDKVEPDGNARLIACGVEPSEKVAREVAEAAVARLSGQSH